MLAAFAGIFMLKLAGEFLKIKTAQNILAGAISQGVAPSVEDGLKTAVTEGVKKAGLKDLIKNALSTIAAHPFALTFSLVATALIAWKTSGMDKQEAMNAQVAQNNDAAYRQRYGSDPAVDSVMDPELYNNRMMEISVQGSGFDAVKKEFTDCINDIKATSDTGWKDINNTWFAGGSLMAMNNTSNLTGIASTTAQKTAGLVSDIQAKTNSMTSLYGAGLSTMNTDTTNKWTSMNNTTGTLVNSLTQGVIGKAGEMENGYNTKLGTMSTDTTSKFTAMLTEAVGAAKDMASGVTSNTSTMASNASSSAESMRSSISSKMSSALDSVLSAASNMAGSMNVYLGKPSVQLPDISVSGIAKGAGLLGSVIMPSWNISWRWFAQGGFPDAGIFLANETGNPEMVGQIGNRPAVANNDQIVAAVSRGVAEAVSRVLGTNNSQAITVNVDGRELFDIMVARNNETVAMTGESPLLV